MRGIYIALLGVILAGCASGNKSLYDWGGYDTMLYSAYKEPATTGANIQKLESHIQKLEQGKQKVPPGLYADLGTLMLQAGKKEEAQTYFRKERELWPESAPLMDALIRNGTMQTPKEAKS